MESQYTQEDLSVDTAIWALIRNEEWNILVLFVNKLWKYSIPIWKVKNWTPEQVLVEEMSEELGISVTDYKEITVIQGEYPYNNVIRKIQTHIFEVISYEGIIRNNEPHKHETMKFMSLDQIKLLSDKTHATQAIVDLFDKRLI